MRLQLKALLRFIAVLLIVFFVSGCIFSDAGKIAITETPVPATPLPTENLSAGKTIIVYARTMDESGATKAVIDEYNKQSDTVYVNYQELPSDPDKLYSQLESAFSGSGSSYDVLDIDIGWVPEFAKKGYITNLSPYISVDGINTGAYVRGAIDALSYEGAVWGLPRNVSAGILYYRKDIIASPPDDWDEILELAGQYSGGSVKYGLTLAGKQGDSLLAQAYELIYACGGGITETAGRIEIETKQSAKGLDLLRKIFDSQAVPDNLSYMSYIDAYVSFMNGEAAFMRNWSSVYSEKDFSEGMSASSADFSALPGIRGGVLSGSALAVCAGSANKNEAWDFVKYVTGYEGQRIISLNSGRFPALMSVTGNEDLGQKYPQFLEESFNEAVKSANPSLISPLYREFNAALLGELSIFLQNKQSAEQTLMNAQARVNGLLNNSQLIE